MAAGDQQLRLVPRQAVRGGQPLAARTAADVRVPGGVVAVQGGGGPLRRVVPVAGVHQPAVAGTLPEEHATDLLRDHRYGDRQEAAPGLLGEAGAPAGRVGAVLQPDEHEAVIDAAGADSVGEGGVCRHAEELPQRRRQSGGRDEEAEKHHGHADGTKRAEKQVQGGKPRQGEGGKSIEKQGEKRTQSREKRRRQKIPDVARVLTINGDRRRSCINTGILMLAKFV
mmetsp:Transcript_2007/g.4667  ORF Transcript_2007/g.4667 Transcript_2007/m.4667 type:complete len:226 (+) Transcript_2007:1379-2056(+)